jgi:DNA-binding response OmpR family regulator
MPESLVPRPVPPDPGPLPSDRRTAPTVPEVSAGAWRGGRLLVVEDEVRMAALLRRGFEEEGYAVDVVGTGADALARATEYHYDAVVLDVMLPGGSGVEVCRELRSRGRWAPVIMVTACDSVPDRIGGLDAGADDYVVKPFSFSELAARVRALIRRGSREPAVLEVGTLRLDPVQRRVWRDGTEVELSRREFSLLELMMRRPGEVLTRTVILEHVWGVADHPRSNIVDQYIAYLRAKVDRAFGHRDIETLMGMGYRLRSSQPGPPRGTPVDGWIPPAA